MTPHCGRLTPHPAHEWQGTDDDRRRTTHHCPGSIVVEGGEMPLCDRCGEQPAAAHGFGRCRWCWAETSGGVEVAS